MYKIFACHKVNVSISDLCNNVDIFVQDPLNEGAWWHSACDTATSHLWVSQRLRLHRRGLDNIREKTFRQDEVMTTLTLNWQHWQDEVLTTCWKIILTRGSFLSDGVCGGCNAGDQHHSKPWCHRCKVCSMNNFWSAVKQDYSREILLVTGSNSSNWKSD